MKNEYRTSYSSSRGVFALAVCILATSVVTYCGGGGPDKTVSPGESTDPSELERGAFELAEARDFEGAVEQMKAALSREPTSQRRLGVAHLLFMNGKHKQALEGYQAYLSVVEGVPARLAADLNEEIDRIDAAVKAGDEPVGRSLASQWLRGSLASLEATDSLDDGEYANAAVSFDKAYQYTGDVELLFEAALAVTRAKDWPRAQEKYIDYLERGQKEVPPEKAYMVRSEIDRLAVIIAGQEPVTWDSLADQIYGERSGDRAPMEEPPLKAGRQQLPLPLAGEGRDGVNEPEVDAGLEEPTASDPEPEAENTKIDEIAARKAEKKAAKEAAKKARQEELKAERERKKAEREEKIAAKKAAKKARQEELKAERERKKAEREEKIAAKKAAQKAAKEAEIEEEPKASGYKQVKGEAASGKKTAHSSGEMPSIQDLMFYAKSRSATVRLRAVKDLISVPDDRARQVLEERMLEDTNMQVRFAAARGLSARRSFASIPVIRKAKITAATSQERAVLKKAMDEIIESRQ